MSTTRGKHRKQSRALQGVAKVAIAGALIGAPMAIAAAPANATPSVNWDAVAQCESGGNWAANTGNGFYGGLQFTLSTWRAYGGSGMPNAASRSTQISVAERVLAGQGIGAWPVCGKRGLGGHTTTQTHTVTTQSAPAVPANPAPTVAPPQSAPNGDYTVAAGDTLSSIAQKANVAGGWQAVWDKNKNVVSNPDLIFPGQKLVTK